MKLRPNISTHGISMRKSAIVQHDIMGLYRWKRRRWNARVLVKSKTRNRLLPRGP